MSKILIVDDNPKNRKLLATLLEYEGYATTVAADGAEGLRVARTDRPNLVISDILMPSMDGYEFVRRLRADPELARTPVIFYTANYHEPEAAALAAECGVAQVLVKPCPQAEVLAAVAQALAQQPPAPIVQPEGGRFDVEHLHLLTNKLSEKAEAFRVANARLNALTDLNLRLASERNSHELLQQVCHGARELLGARYSVLVAAEKSGAIAGSTIQCWSGLDLRTDAVPSLKLEGGLLGRVFGERRTHRVVSDDGLAFESGLPECFPRGQALLAAPVCSLSRTYGWICLVDRVGVRGFSADDEHLLTILGAQVGRIYENGSLYAEIQAHATQLVIEMDQRERAIFDLRTSEERFRQLAETIQDAFFISDAGGGRMHYVSPAYERIWGRPVQSLLENPQVWIEAVHPDDRERILRAGAEITRNLPEPGQLEYRTIRPDGELRWLLTRVFAVRNIDGHVTGIVGVATDITERKAAQESVLKLNRVYAMLSGINSLIVRVNDREELLREACRLAVEQGGFRSVWCALTRSADSSPSLEASAGSFQWLSGGTPASGRLTGLEEVAEALRTGRTVVCNDLAAIPISISPLRKALVAAGNRSLAAIPLTLADQLVGCLILIASDPSVFDDTEMRLLNELAGDIAFALDHIDKAERINYLAYYDALTGLANRTFFTERVAQQARTAAHGGDRFALLVTDLDDFESFNEILGRSSGDELLRLIGSRLAECVDDPDLVARSGPDEFMVLIPRLENVEDLTRTLDNWLNRWLATPLTLAGQQHTFSARGGVAIFPEDGSDAATLMRNAETALKTSKSSGAKYSLYTSALNERLLERRSLESGLRRALEQEQFVLHYQPKVDLETRRLSGVEALLRWQHPERGLILPSKFIPILEENGLIVDVGAWVLRQSSLDRSRWLERSLPSPRIAVNVSDVQLRRDDFVRTVATVLKLAGSEAGLDIEVTETLLMEDVVNNIEKLKAIRELGVSIALDDFGTGYSSLGYLAKLPVETLKIDRSFVVTMLDDPSAMTLVSTVISLAHAMKLQTVAEGVESEEQAKILRLLRCDQMQGYLISKPMPFEEMTQYLSRARN